MRTLFIDSSRRSLSIALAEDDKLIFVSEVESKSKHSNFLINEIKTNLDNNNLTIDDVDNYLVLNGPGSFTGIRVGVTVCKTLAWSLSKKMYQLTNLEALKVGINNETVVTVIPDKEDYSYVGIYSNNNIENYVSINDEILNIENSNITIVTLEENVFTTKLFSKLSSNNNVNLKIINNYNYLDIINYALTKESINPHLAKPVYLKKIDAEKKK